MNENQTSRKMMSYLLKRKEICDEWFKLSWEHNMCGVRTERRKLTCLKEFPNKVLDKNQKITSRENLMNCIFVKFLVNSQFSETYIMTILNNLFSDTYHILHKLYLWRLITNYFVNDCGACFH